MEEQTNEYYRQKYLKYKAKYLALETQVAGGLIDVLKSMNGFYFIFHKNIDKTQIIDEKNKKIDVKIQNMIPDEKPTSISIGVTDIPIFMKNAHQINTLFKDAIIVRLYKSKDTFIFDIQSVQKKTTQYV